MRTSPTHAEKGLGGESRAIAGMLPSAAKAAGRVLQIGGQVMLVESDPVRGGPYRRLGPGALLDRYQPPDLLTVPAPAARRRGRA